MIPGWSITQMNHVRMWADSTPAEVLARQVRKPKDEVEQIIVKLKSLKPAHQKPRTIESACNGLSDQQKATIRRLYPNTRNMDIARKAGCSFEKVKRFAQTEGLRKSADGFSKIRIEAAKRSREVAKWHGKTLTDLRPSLAGLMKARDHLKKGDHITALDIIEDILK